MENDLIGNENCFELAGGSSYKGFELPGVDCSSIFFIFIFYAWVTCAVRRTDP